jgi:hypothetical protein
MDSTVGGASAWTNAHRETAALQRLARDTARFGPGRTGLDVMYGRGARDHIGVMRVHEELASLRAQARIADLLGARGDRNGDDEKAPDHGLFVPVDGDILDALGGEIVPAAAIEDAFVRTGTGLDAALIWLWANPGHSVTDLRMMWPEASVDQRNSLRRHGHQIAIANLGLVWAWMTGNPFPVVIAVLGLRPAWRALFDELSKQRSSQNQTSADAE